ncbi:aminoacyl-tRNA hydrolase [bacterium]|jgi:ribosome-associated protein|nr:aminoacyl-tRNA hydrolase [bacterium]
MIDIDGRFQIPASELSFAYARSSGPGGQNVNKVSSKVIMTWKPALSEALTPTVKERFLRRFGSKLTREGELQIVSQRFRDRPRNVEDAFEKLREMIRSILVVPKTRRPTKPTRGSQERRIAEKKRRSETKSRRRSADD